MRVIVLGSGSKGNSTFVDLGDKKILIDAGFSFNKIKEKLCSINEEITDIDAVFISHDHSDHTAGLKVLLNKVKPILFINKEVEKAVLGYSYENTYPLEEVNYIGKTKVSIIPTSHDAISSCGFLIENNNESLVYITDTGYINHRYFKMITDKTYYIFESNHDTEMLKKGPYPEYLRQRILSDYGHLSNELAAGYLSRIIGPNTKKVVLAHLSETNNDPALALKTVNEILTENEVDFKINDYAFQNEVTVVNE